MYLLEGNIGAGKSTFLKLIEKNLPHIAVTYEPLHTWQADDDGESVLKKFYQNPHRWAYTIETLAMVHRVKDHLAEQQKNPLRIMERSIYSGHYCFAQNDYDNGYMSRLEWNIYNQWFNFLVPNKCRSPLGFIYLKADPQISFERIQKRARKTESGIPLAYLQQIDACHQKFLIDKEEVLPELKNIPVLVVDCNQDFETSEIIAQQHLRAVDEFVKDTMVHTP